MGRYRRRCPVARSGDLPVSEVGGREVSGLERLIRERKVEEHSAWQDLIESWPSAMC